MPLLDSVRHRRMIVIGDLNADPDNPRHVGTPFLTEAAAQGWQIPRPDGPWSFYRGSRIDHAVVSSQPRVLSARYITDLPGWTFGRGASFVSDHAPLVLEVDC